MSVSLCHRACGPAAMSGIEQAAASIDDNTLESANLSTGVNTWQRHFRVGESLKWDLWIMNADGSRQQLRLVAPDDVYGFYSPTWSPDGRSIAFSYFTVQGNVEHVARVNVNNGGMVTLFPGGMQTWSPDGREVLIGGRHASGVEQGLYAVSVNGSMHWRKSVARSSVR
jgi:dipeptidyl aminopeptidase/acylaminoacyl peptidase